VGRDGTGAVRGLELAAAVLGLPVECAKPALVVVGIGLMAVVTAAGPIAFVAPAGAGTVCPGGLYPVWLPARETHRR